jgi:hypothetical protein
VAGSTCTLTVPSLGARVLIEPDKCHVITGIAGAQLEARAADDGPAAEKKPRVEANPGGGKGVTAVEGGSDTGNGASAGARLLHEAVLEQLEQL